MIGLFVSAAFTLLPILSGAPPWGLWEFAWVITAIVGRLQVRVIHTKMESQSEHFVLSSIEYVLCCMIRGYPKYSEGRPEAVYPKNIRPTSSLSNKLSYRMRPGLTENLIFRIYIRLVRCASQNAETSKSWMSRGPRGTYSATMFHNQYRIWDATSHMVTRAAHVVFDEYQARNRGRMRTMNHPTQDAEILLALLLVMLL